MKQRLLAFGVVSGSVVALVAVIGCGLIQPVGPLPPPGTGVVSLAREVQPILNRSCIFCHGESGLGDVEGVGMRLTQNHVWETTVNRFSSLRSTLYLVLPGDAEQSLLFRKVVDQSPPVGLPMPLFGPRLTAEEVALMRDWINQGALNN